MDKSSEILKAFGNKVRIRACGLCVDDNKILLIKHLQIGKNGHLWIPPGGGLNFGESIEECLIREFKEETGLTVSVKDLRFVYEYLQPPLHAVELFFKVEIIEGTLIKGIDPELSPQNQMIDEVKFCDNDFLNSHSPDYFHGAIGIAQNIEGLLKLKGYHYSS
ncbi:MAG TPA: NUDIX hydrolase [Cytophagales bacterium]|nr:NUDIX hydrolase [Cytophagales bacterium]